MSRELFVTVDVAADTETVYDAVTTTDGLRSFWTPQVEGEVAEGAELSFGFEAAPADLLIRVETLSAGEAVDWSCPGPWPGWSGTTIEWRIGEGPDGATRVLLRHADWSDETSDAELGSVTHTWAQVADALVRYAETGDPDPALR